MFIWSLFEFCFIILIAVFIITQMIMPAIINKPTFPLFRKTVKEKDKVEDELRNVCVEQETKSLREQIKNLRSGKKGN